MLEGGATTTTC